MNTSDKLKNLVQLMKEREHRPIDSISDIDITRIIFFMFSYTYSSHAN